MQEKAWLYEYMYNDHCVCVLRFLIYGKPFKCLLDAMWVITVDGFVLIAGFYSGICQKVHIHIKRTELSAIPESRDERKQWLFDSFKEKDRYSEALANKLI